MRNMLEGIEVDDVRYFEELNFQSSHLIDTISEWLTDPAGLPLVLQGDPGSGREYCLEAACYSRKLYDRPWKIVSMDWAREERCDPEKMAERLIEERPDLSREHIDWLTRFAETFNLTKGPVICFDVVSSLILNIPNIVNFVKIIYAEHTAPIRKQPEIDPLNRLRTFLKTILKKYNLILHIRNADHLDFATSLKLRKGVCKNLDDAAKPRQQHGRLLFACSCSTVTRPTDLLSFNHDRILSLSVEASISEQTLRRRIDRNFSPNRFSDELISQLHQHGRVKQEEKFSFSVRIFVVVKELLKRKMLIQKGGCWVRNPNMHDDELTVVIGTPLYDQYVNRLATITPDDLRDDVERFMELAALCRQWIPAQLLMKHMKLDEERADRLVDCLDDVFVDTEPALLIDEQYGYPGFAELCSEKDIAIYRFESPLLAAHQRPENHKQEAENLLAFFDDQLPKNNRAAAALCWQVAEQARPEVQERWRERLVWYYEPTMAGRFSDTLLARMEAGLVSPRALLDRAKEEGDRQSVHFLQAIICACDRWYEEQGGVPDNLEGGLFFNLFGSLLDDLGCYEEALDKHEASLTIAKSLLPGDHLNIATSLNNIGSALI
ncbi:tetratricopeptide repeat protein, partial [Desulfobulbus sp. TB]|nr:tetratricopeptide repeat protein [Desulfobulbus sp. TB]